MGLSLEWFASCLERQRRYVEGRSPAWAEALAVLHREASLGEPAWWPPLARAWCGRSFGPYYEAPGLLLTALHREALAGRAPGLAERLPSCSGSGSGAGEAAAAFLGSAPPAFFEALAGERLQTNEASRAAGWLLTACAGLLPRGTPFHLVDLGTSGGLALVGDYLPRGAALVAPSGAPSPEPPRWRDAPYPVLSRDGLDARPRRLEDAADRLWLKAGIWPDDARRHERFDRAAELFLRLAREPSGPRLHAMDFTEMPGWIASRLEPHREEGLLVYSSQATDFLADEGYRRLEGGLARALEPWGDRGFWAELELPRGGAGEAHELRVHRWLGGRFESRVLATCEAHPRELRLAPGWDFLRPLAAAAPARVTREEPPKALAPGTYRFPKEGDP